MRKLILFQTVDKYVSKIIYLSFYVKNKIYINKTLYISILGIVMKCKLLEIHARIKES